MNGSRQDESDRAVGRPLVSVLPVVCLKDGVDNATLGNALTHDIVCGLKRFRDVAVGQGGGQSYLGGRAADQSRFSGAPLPRYVVQGKLCELHNHARLWVELVDAQHERALWGEHFDRTDANGCGISGDVTAAVLARIAVQIGVAERKRIHCSASKRRRPYGLTLMGQWHLSRYHREHGEMACRLYQRARRLDAGYARAAAGLSRAFNIAWRYGWIDETHNPLGKALEYARTAVRLDDKDARNHGELGFVHLYRKEHAASIDAYERGIELNPADADLLAEMANALAYSGRSRRAIVLLQEAMRLNPFFPDKYLWVLAGAYYNIAEYEMAIETVNKMSNPAEGQRLLAASHAQLGQMQQARHHACEVLRLHPDFSLSSWGRHQPDINNNEMIHFVEGLRKAGLH